MSKFEYGLTVVILCILVIAFAMDSYVHRKKVTNLQKQIDTLELQLKVDEIFISP